jgi:hypothetical protein
MTRSERNRLQATKRRLSSERAQRHGAPPASTDEWWAQIQAIAEENRTPISWDDWLAASANEEV